jgi:hypothetical protein
MKLPRPFNDSSPERLLGKRSGRAEPVSEREALLLLGQVKGSGVGINSDAGFHIMVLFLASSSLFLRKNVFLIS